MRPLRGVESANEDKIGSMLLLLVYLGRKKQLHPVRVKAGWFGLLGGGKGGVLVPGTRLGGVPPLLMVLYRRRLSHGGGGCLSLCLVSFLALLAAQPLDLFLLTLRRCRSPRPALPRLPDLTWPGLAWA